MQRKFVCKRIYMILLGAALLCWLGSCASNDENANYETEGYVIESFLVNEPGENLLLSIGESYRAILLGNGHFISTDLHNEKLGLQDIGDAVTDDDSVTVKATQFTIIDLDDDGESEIVLWIQINGISDYGFEILHYQEGDVYGYTLPYRAFMNLKTDGTFLFSGGAADSGIGKLKPSGDGYTVENIINEAYSEEEFDNAMNQQEVKPDVDWYDLSVDSVSIALEDKF